MILTRKPPSPAPAVEPMALSVRDCAAALSVSERTIKRLIRDGRLRSAKLLGRVVIPTSAIHELLSEGRTEQPGDCRHA